MKPVYFIGKIEKYQLEENLNTKGSLKKKLKEKENGFVSENDAFFAPLCKDYKSSLLDSKPVSALFRFYLKFEKVKLIIINFIWLNMSLEFFTIIKLGHLKEREM
ncbi:hypothetical protein BpHYR1_046792 [Brachionus plicatilis]|uniref:Uncharacterized protein n=1 Tax=Brachionus plicatilis TaxID=10195 RepID=A0A3M7QQC6_BRAPC|nr:hypothetical protein BpHYR1_046792 [Brachionus plicatilis]